MNDHLISNELLVELTVQRDVMEDLRKLLIETHKSKSAIVYVSPSIIQYLNDEKRQPGWRRRNDIEHAAYDYVAIEVDNDLEIMKLYRILFDVDLVNDLSISRDRDGRTIFTFRRFIKSY